MNIQASYKAKEIINAYIKGIPILLRYKHVGGKWHALDNIAHIDWNFAKYDYKVDTKERSEEDFMKDVYKKELGSSFEKVDNGVCRGLYKETS